MLRIQEDSLATADPDKNLPYACDCLMLHKTHYTSQTGASAAKNAPSSQSWPHKCLAWCWKLHLQENPAPSHMPRLALNLIYNDIPDKQTELMPLQLSHNRSDS
jgi:hypothetical protein